MAFLRRDLAVVVASCVGVSCGPPPVGSGATVPVSIESTESSVHVVVRARSDDRVLAKCRTPCEIDLPFGDHHLEVEEEGDTPAAEANFRVRGPTFVRIRDGSRSARDAWAVVALLSSVALPASLYVTASVCWHPDGPPPSSAWCGTPALLTVFGLLVTVPLSWAEFNHEATKVDVRSLPTSQPVVVATNGGGEVGWSFSF